MKSKIITIFMMLFVIISCSSNQNSGGSVSPIDKEKNLPSEKNPILDDEDETIPKENDTSDYDVNKLNDVNTVIDKSGSYKNPYTFKNNVTFVELSFNEKDEHYLKKMNENIKVNYIGVEKEKVDNIDSHPLTTIKAFMDINNDGELNFKDKKFDGNLELIFQNSNNYFKKDGIINFSLGSTNPHLNMYVLAPNYIYNDKLGDSLGSSSAEFFSNVAYLKNKKDNNNLKIVSLGNSLENEPLGNKMFTRNEILPFQISSPTMQEMMRSSTIFGKMIFSDKEKNNKDKKEYYTDKHIYYNPEDIANAMLLRGATVGALPYVKGVKKPSYILFGSSYSAPHISRLAYELKQKFPFLQYNQIKQIILTTADRKKGKNEYLDNILGWGYIDYDKALKGPSDFNAGLIDEQRFYAGIPSRIYDLDDKGNILNRYFYVDINEGEVSSFDNDITSGLKGQGKNNEDEIITYKGRYGYQDSINNPKEVNTYRYRIPKILDSEKAFYASYATAGLRKDGRGELILNGIQYYKSKTQVLDGKLTIRNHSKSPVEVYTKGILQLGTNSKKIYISDIYNQNLVNILGDIDANKYVGYENSEIKILSNAKAHFKEFIGKSKLTLVTNRGEDIEKSNITFDKFDSEIKLTNFILKPIVEFDNNRYTVKFINRFLEYKGKKLEDLSESEKRNIPSWDVNAKEFYKEYTRTVNKKFAPFYREKELYNLTNSMENVNPFAQLFTSSYSNYIYTLFDMDRQISEFKNNIDKSTNDLSAYFNIFTMTNLVDNKINSKFSNNILTNTFVLSKRLNKNIVLNTNIDISSMKSIYSENNETVSSITKFGLGLDYMIDNNTGIEERIEASHILSNIDRFVGDLNVKSDISTILLSNVFSIKNKYILNDKTNLKFRGTIYTTLLKVLNHNTKEVADMNISGNSLLKNRLEFNVENDIKLNDKVEFNHNLGLSFYDNISTKMKVNLAGITFNTKGSELDRFRINYGLGIKVKVSSSLGLDFNANIDNKAKIGIGLGVKYNK